MLRACLGDAQAELTRRFKIERIDKPKHYYCPDFKFKNYLIEVDGDYWHARNRADDEIVHHGLTAKEIRFADEQKNKTYESNGYTVIRIWASDFKKNPELTIQTVINQLNSTK